MMEQVPTADVVVTNPTHYAVALRYEEGRMRAPIVVAKGADLIAARIREIAAEHGVPLIEAPPLARALHAGCELGDEIPAQLYAVVAQLLTYVYQLRAARRAGVGVPTPPTFDDVPVPGENVPDSRS
jgi:flagellar biosynthetic protein FlhB